MGCGSSSVGALDAPDMTGTPVDRLTQMQLEEFQEAFKQYDTDGGGSIDAQELRALMASLGQTPSDEELKKMIDAADADGNGTVDFAEFAALMAHKMHEEKSDQTIKKAFEVFDADKSGFIDSNELKRILANLGEAVTSQQVSAMISKVDENGDGNIDYEEFAKARRRAAPRRACAPRRLTAARIPTQVLVDEESTRFGGKKKGAAKYEVNEPA